MCNHDSSRIIAETGFCFACWHDQQEQKRQARRLEIESAFARGLAIWQAKTVWSTAGVIHTMYGVRGDAVFIDETIICR